MVAGSGRLDIEGLEHCRGAGAFLTVAFDRDLAGSLRLGREARTLERRLHVGQRDGAVYGVGARLAIEDAYGAAVAADEGTRDTVGTADALADLVYVAYGMALETGIPLTEVLAEVQASNLSKLGADGRPIRRDDGKVLKGPDFTEPDIARVLAEHRLAP